MTVLRRDWKDYSDDELRELVVQQRQAEAALNEILDELDKRTGWCGPNQRTTSQEEDA